MNGIDYIIKRQPLHYFDEINNNERFFIEKITELPSNGLEIQIVLPKVGEERDILVISTKTLRGRPVTYDEQSPRFLITFERYIGYAVLNVTYPAKLLLSAAATGSAAWGIHRRCTAYVNKVKTNQEDITVYLDNAYRAYQNEPDSIATIIQDYINSTTSASIKTRPINKNSIVPVVRSFKYLEDFESVNRNKHRKHISFVLWHHPSGRRSTGGRGSAFIHTFPRKIYQIIAPP